jgi:hypothetical protein
MPFLFLIIIFFYSCREGMDGLRYIVITRFMREVDILFGQVPLGSG